MQAPYYCVTETSYRHAWFEVAIKTIVNMAESLADVTDCLSTTPYQFEPTDMTIVKTARAILMTTRRVLPTDLVTPCGALAPNVLPCLELLLQRVGNFMRAIRRV